MKHFFWSKKLIIFLLPLTLLGQVKKNDLTRLSYDELKKGYFDNPKNQTKQIQYATACLIKAKKENNTIRIAKANYWFALLYYDKDGNKAIRYLDSVIKYSKKTNDLNFPAAAYSEKAYLLKKQFKFREAIDNFIMAEKQARLTNIDFYYKVKFSIAVLRSEELGEIHEALDLYRECYNYYKDKEVRTPKYSFAYQDVLFALADAHKALNQTDSATYYNRLGYRESKMTKDEEYAALFALNEGANLILKKKFKVSLDSINNALPKMIAFKNEGNTLAAYYYLGKAYDGLGKKNEAAKNFIRVDSIYKMTKDMSPEFVSGYPFLISYYKSKGDKENQLKYITTYMGIDSILEKNYKELTKKLQKEYDIPHLISEKQSLIQSLKSDKTQLDWLMGGLFLITISVTGFGFYQHRLKKTYRARFEKIIKDTALTNENQISAIPETIAIKKNPEKTEDIGISEELVAQILEKLCLFENENQFLESNITVQTLSSTLETNSKYLSRIVNVYKQKTFIQYINDLRIGYAIAKLQEDPKLRKYRIQALAEEFGFNSAESFSAAFYKKEGIKASFFIKELNENELVM
jgi:AraC-like DNA-binding protein/predicted 3-demethylubiquinone-9 3-methyltransferase (glyoxalase superfamily)